MIGRKYVPPNDPARRTSINGKRPKSIYIEYPTSLVLKEGNKKATSKIPTTLNIHIHILYKYIPIFSLILSYLQGNGSDGSLLIELEC